MKVRIVGTGSMWGKHNSACYLIDDDIMVDFPNGACKYLYRTDIEPSSINHILITHFHGDHYFDIPFLIINKSKHNYTNLNIYCSKDGKNKIKKLGNLAFPNSFNKANKDLNTTYNFNNSFQLNDYKITKLLVDHGTPMPCYGYIFEYKNKTIGFTGDTHYCETVEYMAQICDYLFCDCMFLKGTTKHQGINDINYLLNKYPKCTFVTTHMEESTKKLLKKRKRKNLIVPNDYDIFNI